MKDTKISLRLVVVLIIAFLLGLVSWVESLEYNVFRTVRDVGKIVKDVVGGLAYDSRGKETVFVRVVLSDGTIGIEATPAGASVGGLEVATVPVEVAIENIEKINEWIMRNGFRAGMQDELYDGMRTLDGISDLRSLGGNTTTAVSMAFAIASAKSQGKFLWQYINDLTQGKTKPGLPFNFMNFGNAGKHSISNMEPQEVMLVSLGTKSAREELAMGDKIFAELGKLIEEDSAVSLKQERPYGDEAGYAPIFDEEVLREQGMDKLQKCISLMIEAIQKAGYTPGVNAGIAIDVAANTLWEKAAELKAEEFLDSLDRLYNPTARNWIKAQIQREWGLSKEPVEIEIINGGIPRAWADGEEITFVPPLS